MRRSSLSSRRARSSLYRGTPSADLTDIEACYEAGWSDGLPVVPPTRERIDEMLGEAVARRDEPIVVLPPGGGVATLEKIAANAVMAGCLPDYLPVVEAAVRAVADSAFDLEGCMTTVHSVSPMVLVSGPVASDLKMNGGAGALGSGNRANATIGRALLLCIRNIGLARPGGLDGTTIGHPGKYSYCFTENPESPWPPLSVDRDFKPSDSTATVYAADAPLCICDYGRLEPEGVLLTIAESAAVAGSYNAFFREELWLVMAPEHAEIISRAGWTKADVGEFIFRHARIPAGRLASRGLYGFADEIAPPAWQDGAEPGDLIPIVDRPDRVVVAVAGGPYGGYTAVIFGNGVSVTKKVGER